MNPNQTHYLTAALIQETQAILAGHTSATGQPQTVTIFRADPMQPEPPPPHIWFQARAMRGGDALEVLGNTVGLDSQGNQQYGSVLFGPLVDFGLRCRLAAERDDLFDAFYQAFSGQGVNPATGNRWIVDINVAVGVVVADITETRLTHVETSQFGPLYEATGSLVVTTVSKASAAEQVITAVNINPVTVTLNVPTE